MSRSLIIGGIAGLVLGGVIVLLAGAWISSPRGRATPVASAPLPVDVEVTVTLADTADNPPQAPPTSAPAPTRQAAPTRPGAGITGTVATSGSNLRLRQEPKLLNNVVAMLAPGTQLTIIGRTDDNRWLQVFTPSGETGWVMVDWIVVAGALESVPVTGEGIPIVTPPPPEEIPAPAPAPASSPYPYISNITDTSRQIFARGQSLGNRANVFSKVGDSITATGVFLNPIGHGDYNLGQYGDLEPVIGYYSQEIARDDNSFANESLAALGGWSAWHVTNPESADEDFCEPDETPLVCEYRIVRPAVALIMLGTNDVPTAPPQVYEWWMRQIIETSIDMGVIPVVSTIPAFHNEEDPQDYINRVAVFNGILTGLAHQYGIPLWDYWSAMAPLPNDGLSDDGIHPSWALPTDFSPENLQYGMTMRNLTALQALDAIWKEVLS